MSQIFKQMGMVLACSCLALNAEIIENRLALSAFTDSTYTKYTDETTLGTNKLIAVTDNGPSIATNQIRIMLSRIKWDWSRASVPRQKSQINDQTPQKSS